MATVYLALGANLGDRRGALRAAVEALGARDIAVSALSPVYETDAVAPAPQPAYLNQVLRAETALPPTALLARCLEVEAALGRTRVPGVRDAPREIDVDLLLYGAEVIQAPGLAVPHPRLLERPFVRIPLAAVATPGLRHPVTGERLDRAEPHPGVRPAPAG